MRLRPGGFRLRLVDAVVIAAGALLVLKLIGLGTGGRTEAAEPAAGELPSFARVLAKARTNYEPPDIAMTGAVTKEDGKEPAKAPAPAGSPPPDAAARPPAETSPSERSILERLGERRDALQQRNKDMELRERLLENAERKLESRINELKAIEEKNESAATKRGETEAGALKNLVVMYEAMKPKDAARVFDRLTLDVLVPVVLQMNPRKMAEILAAMQPESAERLTVALATRARGLGDGKGSSASAAVLPPNELPSIDAAKPGR